MPFPALLLHCRHLYQEVKYAVWDYFKSKGMEGGPAESPNFQRSVCREVTAGGSHRKMGR
jgi:hypothetical protein